MNEVVQEVILRRRDLSGSRGTFINLRGRIHWLEEVELQDSAYPYHDWNERITAECYAPNTGSRILDPGRRIVDRGLSITPGWRG